MESPFQYKKQEIIFSLSLPNLVLLVWKNSFQTNRFIELIYKNIHFLENSFRLDFTCLSCLIPEFNVKSSLSFV